jgi:two-component system nitrate/nitrite response regulator NarL
VAKPSPSEEKSRRKRPSKEPADSSPVIRVLLVDDQPVIRAALRELITSEAAIEVVGEADNLADAVAGFADEFDLVLLNLTDGDRSTLNSLPELLAKVPTARALVLASVRDREGHTLAMRYGAMGIAFKERTPELLVKAVQKVHAGEVWLERAMMATVLGEMSRAYDGRKTDLPSSQIATLTDREHQVVGLIGEGLKNKQIAARLFISETTVRHHLTSIFDKLNVADRCELVVYAFRNGMARPGPVKLSQPTAERTLSH